ncbi:unnamed protein product [Adineta ricciae]|uniref:Uncharacterized protein n=1 Tax=Adineta ricciae TaxID=249248 RepID=A0A815W268_ADIRI|nr:unnamed protein product [Adineta ricciae]CAF1535392.1 unnamed protein product [Adineta ricciae]
MDRSVALVYADDTKSTNRHVKGVLFEIDANPELFGIQPFANISSISQFEDEAEVLFAPGSIFRIVHIFSDHSMWIIRMVLCGDNDHDLTPILNHMKKEYTDNAETHVGSLGCILVKMGKFDQAKRYLVRCFEELPPNHYNTGVCHHYLGIIASEKGDYDSNLECYNKSLKIKRLYLAADHPSIAMTYNCLGSIYLAKGEYTQAIVSYNKSLRIFKRKHGINHINIAECFSNIGCVYFKQKKYFEAQDYYRNALTIQQQQLPSNHYHIGESYVNLAGISWIFGELESALKYYKNALDIFQKSLPDLHLRLALVYHGMGAVYVKKKQFQEALSNFERAADIWRHILPSNHPHSIKVTRNIQYCRHKLNQ